MNRVSLICDDSRRVEFPTGEVLILDPPWDDLDAWGITPRVIAQVKPASMLVFCGPRELGQVIDWYGTPRWVFTWDTMSPWRRGDAYPLQRSKFCLHYGDHYDQTAEGAQIDTGKPASARHPNRPNRTTRALADVYPASLRWLHNPELGDGTTERHRDRSGPEPLRHAKPVEWVRALIAATSPDPEGLVVDPFAGSGTSLIAARDLDRPAFGVELDPTIARFARDRIDRGETACEQIPGQEALW